MRNSTKKPAPSQRLSSFGFGTFVRSHQPAATPAETDNEASEPIEESEPDERDYAAEQMFEDMLDDLQLDEEEREYLDSDC